MLRPIDPAPCSSATRLFKRWICRSLTQNCPDSTNSMLMTFCLNTFSPLAIVANLYICSIGEWWGMDSFMPRSEWINHTYIYTCKDFYNIYLKLRQTRIFRCDPWIALQCILHSCLRRVNVAVTSTCTLLQVRVIERACCCDRVARKSKRTRRSVFSPLLRPHPSLVLDPLRSASENLASKPAGAPANRCTTSYT